MLDLLVAVEAIERHASLIGAAARRGVAVSSVASQQLAALTDTVTPQGVVAICRMVDVTLHTALAAAPDLVVLCDAVRDPGNLGTIIRCADAFGAAAVLVSAESADLYNPKAVRATTGSLFHLPVARDVDVAAAIAAARAAGCQVLGADVDGDVELDDLAAGNELARPTLWVLGNEAWGLPEQHRALVDRLVAIPIWGHAESLNLAAAAAVVLWASASSQRTSSPTESLGVRPAS